MVYQGKKKHYYYENMYSDITEAIPYTFFPANPFDW